MEVVEPLRTFELVDSNDLIGVERSAGEPLEILRETEQQKACTMSSWQVMEPALDKIVYNVLD